DRSARPRRPDLVGRRRAARAPRRRRHAGRRPGAAPRDRGLRGRRDRGAAPRARRRRRRPRRHRLPPRARPGRGRLRLHRPLARTPESLTGAVLAPVAAGVLVTRAHRGTVQLVRHPGTPDGALEVLVGGDREVYAAEPVTGGGVLVASTGVTGSAAYTSRSP